MASLKRTSLTETSMRRVEFYTFEDQVWYRQEDGSQHQLTDKDRDAVRFIIEQFQEFYPEAFEACANEYKRCQANLPHFQFVLPCGFASATSELSTTAHRMWIRMASSILNTSRVPCAANANTKMSSATRNSTAKYRMRKCG